MEFSCRAAHVDIFVCSQCGATLSVPALNQEPSVGNFSLISHRPRQYFSSTRIMCASALPTLSLCASRRRSMRTSRSSSGSPAPAAVDRDLRLPVAEIDAQAVWMPMARFDLAGGMWTSSMRRNVFSNATLRVSARPSSDRARRRSSGRARAWRRRRRRGARRSPRTTRFFGVTELPRQLLLPRRTRLRPAAELSGRLMAELPFRTRRSECNAETEPRNRERGCGASGGSTISCKHGAAGRPGILRRHHSAPLSETFDRERARAAPSDRMASGVGEGPDQYLGPPRIVSARPSQSRSTNVRADVGVTARLPPCEPRVPPRLPATNVEDEIGKPECDDEHDCDHRLQMRCPWPSSFC